MNSENSRWAHFDPASFSFQFSSIFTEIAPKDLVSALRAIPPRVLTHEVAHAFQVGATAAGIRFWSETQIFISTILEAASVVVRNCDGTLPLGLVYLRDEFANDPENGRIQNGQALRNAATYRSEFLGGGETTISPRDEELEGMLWMPGTRFFFQPRTWIKGIGVREHSTHFRIYSKDNIGSPRLVQLGAIHLLEGQGASAEEMRIASELAEESWETIRDAINNVRQQRPTNPYFFAEYMYQSIACEGRIPSPWEFALVVDTSLMLGRADGDAVISFDNAFPFDHFLTFLEIMGSTPSLALENYEDPKDALAFQNALLGAAGVKETMLELSQRLPKLIDQVTTRAEGGLFRSLIPFVKTTMEEMVDLRFEFGGLSPTIPLAVSDIENLIEIAADIPLSIGSTQWTRAECGVNPGLFDAKKLHHVQTVIDEMAFGPTSQGCPFIADCALPRRKACFELTMSLMPSEEQCPREGLIADFVSLLGIKRIAYDPTYYPADLVEG